MAYHCVGKLTGSIFWSSSLSHLLLFSVVCAVPQNLLRLMPQILFLRLFSSLLFFSLLKIKVLHDAIE